MRDFHLPGRSAVFAQNAMIATSNPLASQVGLSILEKGGNAFDAAIAAAILQGVLEPQMTGIGGDCFVIFQPAGSDEVITLNGSGRAPAALDPNVLRTAGHDVMPKSEAASVTVPGAVAAFCKLSDDYGKLGLSEVLAPSIHYMKEGVPIGPRTVFDWAQSVDRLQGAAKEFFSFGGKAPTEGQIFSMPKQADVLERISKQGSSAFYQGEVAQDMVDSLRALGGVHTMEDFANVACNYGSPISGNYKGYELLEHAPNGQGATAILLNNILSHFDIASMDPLGTRRAHIETEAAKLAYDTRNRFLADPDEMTRLEHMLSLDTASELAKLIDPARVMANATELSENVHRETICLSCVDRDRNVVSLIYSVFDNFGSGLASSKFGIGFHNRGSGFNLIPGHPNEARGGKRPMHTIIPAILRKEGKVLMPFGVMGGAYQANGHARFLSNIIDFGMHPQMAIDAPRTFHDLGEMRVERGYSDQVQQELKDLGHNVVIPDTPIGGAQAIWIDPVTGVLQGASDPRKDGCALGY